MQRIAIALLIVVSLFALPAYAQDDAPVSLSAG